MGETIKTLLAIAGGVALVVAAYLMGRRTNMRDAVGRMRDALDKVSGRKAEADIRDREAGELANRSESVHGDATDAVGESRRSTESDREFLERLKNRKNG